MLERVEARFAYKPARLMGDTAYGSASMLEWLVEGKGIAPHIPVMDKSAGKPELFGRSDFTWEADNDRYHCPGGNYLQRFWRHYTKPRTGITKANTIIYKSTQRHCDRCKLKPVCCRNVPYRKIARSIYETSRDVARDISKTVEYQQSCNDRKKVEVLFAHLKRILNFDRLRLRGITGAGDEFLMAATVQNLKKLAQLRFKPPDDRIIAPA